MRLKLATSAVVLACAVTMATPAFATDKDDLLAKGLQRMTDAEVAESKIGKTIKGKYIPQQMLWQNEYKADGTKVVTFGGKSFNKEWSFDDGRWCETTGKKINCDVITYKLDGQCYIFGKNGNTEHKFMCE